MAASAYQMTRAHTHALWSQEGPPCCVLEGSAFRRGNRRAAHITSKCHDSGVQRKRRGSHVHLLCAALAALMVSFAEPSCSAATAIVRNWLCPSHTCVFPCLASPGPGRVVLAELGLGWVHCLCPPRMCLLVWQGSPLTTPQASKQPDFPQMGLCVYQHEVRPVSICLPQSPQHQALTQEVAVDPGGTAGISLQDLINQVAWKTFLSSPHTPHPLGD